MKAPQPRARALVWLKRDLRLADHAALAAAARCTQAAALYVIEPEWIASPECDPQHVAFAAACVEALRHDLAARGLPLLVRVGSAAEVLSAVHACYPFDLLLSHEETGPGWSYARDRHVRRWCRERGVAWIEHAHTGVVRRLASRDGWAAAWQARMDAPAVAAPVRFRGACGLDPGAFPTLAALGLPAARPLPEAGGAAARATLASFLDHRGRRYRDEISSPLSAERGCSRLSAHLAFGTVSMREVHQATEARIAALRGTGDERDRRTAYHLRGFAGRLRWHCHFMQKLEDEPAIEHRNLARSADGLREPVFDRTKFEAWREGRTGFPMVDACMRCLNATGWINFRMRAMLVSFAAHHLWLHWREPGLHLARQFLDFEPGIHWSQMQMQSGTTGINALRIYSPAKQAADHDPQGVFVRRWVPEHGTSAYPAPIVDERAALAHAKQVLYGLRRGEAAREEARAIQAKHGSRKSGLPQGGARTTATRAGGGRRAAPPQGDLFE